jgi:hypothetical protein
LGERDRRRVQLDPSSKLIFVMVDQHKPIMA